MKQVSHVNDIVGLHDDYGCYGVFTKAQFQLIKQCDSKHPVPATMENVDMFWRQYWRTSNMGEYRSQYD